MMMVRLRALFKNSDLIVYWLLQAIGQTQDGTMDPHQKHIMWETRHLL